jgi:hypothetical protein
MFLPRTKDFQTQLNGLYRLSGTSLSKFSTEADSEMMANSVYSSLLSDGSYVIGTVSNGFYFDDGRKN